MVHSMGVVSEGKLIDSWDGLVSHTERSDDSGWGTWEATSMPNVSLSPVETSMTIPSLPSLAMVVYNPSVEPVQETDSANALPALPASSPDKSTYPMSSLGNFTPFSTLTNDEIMCLIEDYGVVFHTSDNKKT
jgi:hypothetical protein